MAERVQILMATYNGSRYISNQLQSITDQSYEDWSLLIHDDESTDSTNTILELYSTKEAGRVEIVYANKLGNARDNFSFLIGESNANYIFFSDQDDVWKSHKIDRMMKVIKFYESVYGENFPLLVHTDLQVTDSMGEKIAESLWKYQNLDPSWGDSFNLVLTQNVVTGCATIVNRALLDRAMPVPKKAVMHDWWLALVATAYGKVIWMDEPLVSYRQHSSNSVGAKSFNLKYIINRIKFGKKNLIETQSLVAEQANEFAIRYPESMYSVQAQVFSSLNSLSLINRILAIKKHKFFKIGNLRNFVWMVLK